MLTRLRFLAGRFERWWFTITGVLAMTAVTFVAANVVCGIVLTSHPSLVEPDNQRTRDELLDRLATIDFGTLRSWLAIDSVDEARALLAERRSVRREPARYEEFTDVRPVPWRGRFLNVTEAGYREVANQGPWPPSPEFFNVFFFGGSTAYGSILPDWATIASAMQAQLADRRVSGKAIRIYNFGRPAYFSTQERILFQQLLVKGFTPAVAVFLDGANDFFFLDGRSSGAETIDQAIRDALRAQDQSAAGGFAGIDFGALRRAIQSLPVARVATVVRAKFAARSRTLAIAGRPAPTQAQLQAVVQRYLENKRQIEAVARAYGIRALFVWQPTPGYKYDLRYHILLDPRFRLGGHEHAGLGYALMAEQRSTGALGDDFLWLADVQEQRTDVLYIDAVHYTAAFSAEIARAIGTFLTAPSAR